MVGRDRHLHTGWVTESGVDVPQDPGQRPQPGGSALGRKRAELPPPPCAFLLENCGLCQLLDSLFRE